MSKKKMSDVIPMNVIACEGMCRITTWIYPDCIFTKPHKGIGSSAASAAGAVFGANELMGRPYSNHELVKFAAEGERVACGTPIADSFA